MASEEWDTPSFLLDLSRFNVLDIRRRSDTDVKLPAATLLDAVFIQQQHQLLHPPFVPRLLQRMKDSARAHLQFHVCFGTVRYRRRLEMAGPHQTRISIHYETYLHYAVRKFMRDNIDINGNTGGFETMLWRPEDARTADRPHPFVAMRTLKDLISASIQQDVSPPVVHVFQCLVDWPTLLGVHDKRDMLTMASDLATKPDEHAVLVIVMSDMSQAYYFDPTGLSCTGSRRWRYAWEEALGKPLADLVSTPRQGAGTAAAGEDRRRAWGPQVLPALLRQPNRQINISAQWCYAWCTMVAGLLLWNCCRAPADVEKIGAYLYAKRAKLRPLSIKEQATYMDRKIRNFVMYMDEITQKTGAVSSYRCDTKMQSRRRPPSTHPTGNVYDEIENTEQFWDSVAVRGFTPVIHEYSVDDPEQAESPAPPARPGTAVDALTPPRKPQPRRGADASAKLTENMNRLNLRGGGGSGGPPPSPAPGCRRKLVRAWGGGEPARPACCACRARAPPRPAAPHTRNKIQWLNPRPMCTWAAPPKPRRAPWPCCIVRAKKSCIG